MNINALRMTWTVCVCARVPVACYVTRSSESQVLIIPGLATGDSNNHPLMISRESLLLLAAGHCTQYRFSHINTHLSFSVKDWCINSYAFHRLADVSEEAELPLAKVHVSLPRNEKSTSFTSVCRLKKKPQSSRKQLFVMSQRAVTQDHARAAAVRKLK